MFAGKTYLENRKALFADGLALCAFFIIIFYFIALTRHWTGAYHPETEIDLSTLALPKYAFFSLLRALLAYSCSFIFTLVIGFAAAKSKIGERILLPLLDIGQSIPVLGFMPGFVLGLISIFPHNNLGLELACILLIFTGQVWNMTFSLYASLKSIPANYVEMSNIVGLNWFERFRKIEFPSSTISFTWNSMMSMAGGWFFLIACESFTLGTQTFRLPGLGAYMAVAMEKNDQHAVLLGVFAMCLVIVLVDFGIWRPIIAWSRKFRLEEHEDEIADIPFVSMLLKESKILVMIQKLFATLRGYQRAKNQEQTKGEHPLHYLRFPFSDQLLRFKEEFSSRFSKRFKTFLVTQFQNATVFLAIVLALWGLSRLYELTRTLELIDWLYIAKATSFTFMRVLGALILGSLWAIPFGIWIGLSSRRTRIVQPIIQVAASFPAPMLYPIAIAIFLELHFALSISSMILMLMGVQWYILFNVLSGATSIPRESRDMLRLIGVARFDLWKKLFLPAVFPSLIVGWITAAGGAWNASIIAEYFQYKGQTMTTTGLGSLISAATEKGDFHLLSGCLIAMVITVVGVNRLVWRRLQRYAESHYKFEG